MPNMKEPNMRKPNYGERIKMVKCMEFIARQLNNEDILEGWLMDGVADGDIDYGDTDGMDKFSLLDYYIKDENFADIMDAFLWAMFKAYKDGGLYCDWIVSKPINEEE